MNNAAEYKIEPISLINDDLLLQETIFHNANGYIGVRSCFEEGYKAGYNSIRGTYINGFYDIARMKQPEKLYGLIEEKQTIINVVDTQAIQLKLGDETFSMFEGTVLESSRWLDMENGYTARRVLWRSPAGKEVEIEIRRMTSFTRLSLFTIDYRVKSVNYEGEITFLSSHIADVANYFNPNDPRVASETFRHLNPGRAGIVEGASYILTNTSNSGLAVCTGVKNILYGECETEHKIDEYHAVCSLRRKVKLNETVRLIKYTVVKDSIRCRDCRSEAIREMKKSVSVTMEKLYEEQSSYLKTYWKKSLLEIKGDHDLNLAVRYNLYQLVQSVGKDKHGTIAAKGLSGEGYEGHYFWDTEMYIQPFFTLTNPEIAKNLLEYRYHTLNEARENARILGHKQGALYPWRTIMGKECSGYFPSGSAQYHINGDIAHAVAAYYLVTKDFDFIIDKGFEIVLETARLWMDTGHFCNGLFHIYEVTGPDEYTCMVNNNYYTNACAQHNLRWTVKFYRMMEETRKNSPDCAEKIVALYHKTQLTTCEIEAFEEAEKKMYLPYDKNLKINPQDDSFLNKKIWDIQNTPADKFPLLLHYHPLYLYRHQVCKQADTVLAHFVFEDVQDMETIRNSFLYYEKITTHDSSLSTCIFSIVASRLGMEEKAYAYFGDSAKLDLFNTHHNTKDGIHTANMGGTYMAIVYGFAGLRIREEGLHFAPTLPKQWEGYRFRISYAGCEIQICVLEEHSQFVLLSGEPLMVHVYDKEHTLTDQITVSRKNR